MTDLRKLIEAVEAATWTVETHPIHETPNFTEFYNAYHGSLDAAKALHDALLPGCNQAHVDWGPSGCGATAVWWPDGLSGAREIIGEGYDGCPARALLVAILKAKEAQQ